MTTNLNNATLAFERLVKIMDELREKCPWDRKQTIGSLREHTIEETYELADAITDGNWEGIREEIGDLLLHVVFYARIGSEEKKFELSDAIHAICDKLIARHPHIYGDVKVQDDAEVKRNWEKLKFREGKKSALSGVPQSLPAMVKAMRLQEKAKQVGFEWEAREQVWEKVKEEMAELQESIRDQEPGKAKNRETEEEFGDLLFSLVNYARFLDIDPENALELTNKKFISRFQQMEQDAQKEGKKLTEMSLEEMDAIWNKIKLQSTRH
jgi:MazG family protein